MTQFMKQSEGNKLAFIEPPENNPWNWVILFAVIAPTVFVLSFFVRVIEVILSPIDKLRKKYDYNK